MDIIRAQSLLKVFPDYWKTFTLGRVNLQLDAGRILGIIGPEKSGKTSLLQLFWGALRPTSGKLEVLGLDPYSQVIELRRRAGYVDNDGGFYEEMTVREYLNFIAGFYPAWDHSRAEALTNRLGVEPSSAVYQLPAEGKVKLRLIAALGHRPKALFLDEPTLKLAPAARNEIHSFLRDLAAEEYTGIIISAQPSHNLNRLVDSVLMLCRGTVLHCGPAEALKQTLTVDTLEEAFHELDAAHKLTSFRHA